jgi:hypothetical protein
MNQRRIMAHIEFRKVPFEQSSPQDYLSRPRTIYPLHNSGSRRSP